MYRIVIDGKERWQGMDSQKAIKLYETMKSRALHEAILYAPHNEVNVFTGQKEKVAIIAQGRAHRGL